MDFRKHVMRIGSATSCGDRDGCCEAGENEVKNHVGLDFFERGNSAISGDHVCRNGDRIVLVEHRVGAGDDEIRHAHGVDRVAKVDDAGDDSVADHEVLIVQVVVQDLPWERGVVDARDAAEHFVDQPASERIGDRVGPLADDPDGISEIPEEPIGAGSELQVCERVHHGAGDHPDLGCQIRRSADLAVRRPIDPCVEVDEPPIFERGPRGTFHRRDDPWRLDRLFAHGCDHRLTEREHRRILMCRGDTKQVGVAIGADDLPVVVELAWQRGDVALHAKEVSVICS